MWLFLLVACPKDVGPPSQMVVTAGEDQVWPPSAPECAGVVACCDALAELESAMAVVCPIVAATRKTCPEIAASALIVFAERSNKEPPQACQPFAPAP